MYLISIIECSCDKNVCAREGYRGLPFKSSASGRWNRFTHAHHGTIDVSNTTSSLLLDDTGLASSNFLLTTSARSRASTQKSGHDIVDLSSAFRVTVKEASPIPESVPLTIPESPLYGDTLPMFKNSWNNKTLPQNGKLQNQLTCQP